MKVFSLKQAKDMAKGHDIKVVLKKNYKGVSLFAKKSIKKGSVVAYYKFLVNKYDDNFEGENNNISTTVSQNNGEISTSSYEYVLLIK